MATKLRESRYADMRSAMIDCQLRPNAVIDAAVVAAMARVARENFVPAELAGVAYTDRSIALGGGRRLNAPLVTAKLIVDADVAADQRILLIGAASGYSAAILTAMGSVVVAVESDPALAVQAAAALAGSRAVVVTGAMALGAPDYAPFDRVIIDGAVAALPAAIADQLREGGVVTTALIDGVVSRLARGVKIGGAVVLRPFADMDAVALPGFSLPETFAF